jgi:60 kDa SS-A/Ro ribonucleoprotein
LTPRNNSQIKTRQDVLQVGGFSDTVFDVVSSFVEHGFETDHWVSEIEKVSLD